MGTKTALLFSCLIEHMSVLEYFSILTPINLLVYSPILYYTNRWYLFISNLSFSQRYGI